MDETVRQLPIDELAPRLWDVLIAGAGPAGATTAITLARRGYRVVLLDQESFPRDKVCGDALIADSVRCLEHLGLSDRVATRAHRVQCAAVYSPARIRMELPGAMLTLKRRELDLLLVQAAVEAGAAFTRGTVTGFESQADGSLLFCADGRLLRARVGVLATGVRSKLGRELGLVTRSAPDAVAMRQYMRSTRGPREMVFSYDRSILPGYAWIFPLGDDEYNVGCGVFRGRGPRGGTNLRNMMARFLDEFPIARELAAHGEAISPLEGAPLRCGLSGARQLGAANLLAVGELIGSTLPLTGEGVGKAMETGELAAEVIHDALRTGDFARLRRFYPRLQAELRPRFRGYEIAARWMSHPWFADLFARRYQRSVFLRRTISGLFDESVDPRQAFSLGGLLRSLFA